MATRSLIGIQRAESQEIEALITLGSISSLGLQLESTVAYHRDFDQEPQPSKKYADMRDLMASARVDHVYVWSVHDERWHHYAVR